MPFKEPFKLGPFFVDTDGRLIPNHPDAIPGFSVRWRGRLVQAQLTAQGDEDGTLTIHSNLGRVPSSIADPAVRAAYFTMLRTLVRQLPAPWALRLRPDHQQQLRAETPITLPCAAAALVTEVTAFLLELNPYLDMMERAGVRPDASPA